MPVKMRTREDLLRGVTLDAWLLRMVLRQAGPEVARLVASRVKAHEVVPGLEVSAEVNAGRWLVRCPFCASAQLAPRGGGIYWCVDCYMAGADGRWAGIRWPADADAIEAVLLRRPDPGSRNWTEAETVADLEAENREHGVMV